MFGKIPRPNIFGNMTQSSHPASQLMSGTVDKMQSGAEKFATRYGNQITEAYDSHVAKGVTKRQNIIKENAIQHTQSDAISSDVQSVYDMKYAWHIASSTACELSVYSILLLYVGVGLFKKQYPDFLGNELLYVSILAVVIQFFVIFFSVWRAHHPAVIFEMGKIGTLNFCAQDVENSFLDYILFRKTRNSWKRRTLLVSDVYRVDNEVFQ